MVDVAIRYFSETKDLLTLECNLLIRKERVLMNFTNANFVNGFQMKIKLHPRRKIGQQNLLFLIVVCTVEFFGRLGFGRGCSL
jgi:hypothetical protein